MYFSLWSRSARIIPLSVISLTLIFECCQQRFHIFFQMLLKYRLKIFWTIPHPEMLITKFTVWSLLTITFWDPSPIWKCFYLSWYKARVFITMPHGIRFLSETQGFCISTVTVISIICNQIKGPYHFYKNYSHEIMLTSINYAVSFLHISCSSLTMNSPSIIFTFNGLSSSPSSF